MGNSSSRSKQEEENKALALRYHGDIFQNGMLEVADEILSPDFVIHNPVLPEALRKGPEGTNIILNLKLSKQSSYDVISLSRCVSPLYTAVVASEITRETDTSNQ